MTKKNGKKKFKMSGTKNETSWMTQAYPFCLYVYLYRVYAKSTRVAYVGFMVFTANWINTMLAIYHKYWWY